MSEKSNIRFLLQIIKDHPILTYLSLEAICVTTQNIVQSICDRNKGTMDVVKVVDVVDVEEVDANE